MNKKVIGAVIVLTFLVGCGCQQGATDDSNVQEGDQTGANAITYNCGDQTIKADFNNETEPKTATIYAEDKNASVTLPNVESGSGAKYSDGEFTFWTHQGDATLSVEDSGKSLNCTEEASATDEIVDENGNTVAEGCETWFDGCNTCQVSADGMMACTRMFCDPATMQVAKCMDEESIDEDKQNCTEAGGVWSEEHNSCFEDPATMAGEGEK
ncbi:MAG: MliC family protein [Patescibacteria group bacterium]|nr:MliC family protein [Patescibacteria group bacterium]